MIYMDNAATTPMLPEVVKEMEQYYQQIYANPSSAYQIGREAKREINIARAGIAELIDAEENEIIFTSGGSESNTTALMSTMRSESNNKKHIIVSSVEHASVLKTAEFLNKQGYDISYARADAKGYIDPKEVERLIRSDTALVSVMLINNELGTIEPVADISRLLINRNIMFHTDAVTAMGHMLIDVKKMGIDLLSASAHKFGGPKGVGFLFCKNGVKLEPLILGGGQEQGLRAGTENVASIMGMYTALKVQYLREQENRSYQEKLRIYLLDRIRSFSPTIKINGPTESGERLASIVHVSFPDVSAEKLLMYLDMDEIYASGGSACQSSSRAPSHVLQAIGMSLDQIKSSIRLSFSENTTYSDIDGFINSLEKNMKRCKIR